MAARLLAEMNDALTAVLADMQSAVTDLDQVLGDERAALDQADADALNRVGERKQQLLLQLEQLDTERVQLVRHIDSQSDSQQQAWDGILRLVACCQQANQRNGDIVEQRLQHVRRALSVLTGGKDEVNVYNPAGKVRGGFRSVPLAQA
ncbi:MAG TPA: flagellar export chaperone FlgN [Dyella sp.]|uniref:flagellar export chaperone FlgN n=1 Tax=Dyella sp. TaxID=1869338 RepID=UPI002F943027